MSAITNIAAYRFARLTDLKALRERLLGLCKGWQLKGTILLSTEGINLFVAGGRAEIEALVAELRAISGLEAMAPKVSESEEQPFSRMLVRIKREIISFGVEGIEPGTRTSPKLAPRELKRWLDEGRAVTLLDTRNDYEVKLGTFRGAKVLEIDHFREFPRAVKELPEAMKRTPVVMFCTGGIRCEKAGPYMEREGFEQIFQLDGGILKYFEEVGGDHYDGECFVFDQRVGVDPALRESEAAICFVCQTPLTVQEQADARFVPNVGCPYCHRDSEEAMAASIAKRQAEISVCTSPLPGSRPYQNERPLNIPAEYDGAKLLEALRGIFPHVAVEEWREVLASGGFVGSDRMPVNGEQRVRAGERYTRITPSLVEPEVNAAIRIIYEDEALVVLEKPAPLPMHPSGRFNRNTLQFILQQAYAPQKIQAAHRLDANTTGLVVCTRTRHFAKLLQPQFARGEVEKTYLARVQGWPKAEGFCCDAPIGIEAGIAGARDVDDSGLAARTDFTVIRRLADGTTLLEARPLTGRTNQIRVHLWTLGFPINGDGTYLPGGVRRNEQTLGLDAPAMQLHAARITFTHPLSKERMTFAASYPMWWFSAINEKESACFPGVS